MYKLSVPMCIETINDKSFLGYVEEFKRGGVDRIFLSTTSSLTRKDFFLYTNPDKMAKLISDFKKEGFEVGVWLSAFGHGSILAHDRCNGYVAEFSKIRGYDGREADEGFCPLDENFRKYYYDGVRKIASMEPDIIMFDDDFRLNIRQYEMGCCCDRHMKLFCERVGENVSFDKMEELVFTGGPNKYRDAWLEISKETLLGFAHHMRNAVDEVNPDIRLGCCAVYTTWDFEGTDLIEIAKAFAGKTRPYIRTIGAPYHGLRVQYAVEHTRMQASWCTGENIELFAEGDVYPRPRYAVGSRLLEVFDNALVASGAVDGILKYMFDYNYSVNYEKGYNDRHIKNKPLRDGIRAMFDCKKHIGVRVYEAMHKIRDFELSAQYVPNVSKFAWNTYFSIAQKLLSENAIPTVYEHSDNYPVIVFGENARHIELSEIKNGAIIDVVAAKILAKRGVDTGYIFGEPCEFFGEYFIDEDDEIRNISSVCMQKAEVSDKACIKSRFTPDGTPASYTYENSNGQRFMVLCIDAYRSEKNNYNYFNNYYRQSHLIETIEWMCGSTLPAVCTKNPYLYMQAARGEDGALTVALFNMHIDEIPDAKIILDRTYSQISFLNCTGELCANTVKLTSEIEPYGTVVFEVR